jgi:curved DNA-binding protein CbpA
VTHYEVLGVGEGASIDEIRRAYFSQAREHHPDHREANGGGRPDVEADAASDAAIRAANAAWEVLSDPERRAAYDEHLALGGAGGPEVRRGPTIRHLDDTFVPYNEFDEDDDDAWRYEPDEGDPRTAPARSAVLAPIALGICAVLTLLTALLLGEEVFLYIAAALGALSLLGFVFLPLSAMARAAKFENE